MRALLAVALLAAAASGAEIYRARQAVDKHQDDADDAAAVLSKRDSPWKTAGSDNGVTSGNGKGRNNGNGKENQGWHLGWSEDDTDKDGWKGKDIHKNNGVNLGEKDKPNKDHPKGKDTHKDSAEDSKGKDTSKEKGGNAREKDKPVKDHPKGKDTHKDSAEDSKGKDTSKEKGGNAREKDKPVKDHPKGKDTHKDSAEDSKGKDTSKEKGGNSREKDKHVKDHPKGKDTHKDSAEDSKGKDTSKEKGGNSREKHKPVKDHPKGKDTHKDSAEDSKGKDASKENGGNSREKDKPAKDLPKGKDTHKDSAEDSKGKDTSKEKGGNSREKDKPAKDHPKGKDTHKDSAEDSKGKDTSKEKGGNSREKDKPVKDHPKGKDTHKDSAEDSKGKDTSKEKGGNSRDKDKPVKDHPKGKDSHKDSAEDSKGKGTSKEKGGNSRDKDKPVKEDPKGKDSHKEKEGNSREKDKHVKEDPKGKDNHKNNGGNSGEKEHFGKGSTPAIVDAATKPESKSTTVKSSVVTIAATTKTTPVVSSMNISPSSRSSPSVTVTTRMPTHKQEVDQKPIVTSQRATQTLSGSTTTLAVILKDQGTSPSTIFSTAKATQKAIDTTVINKNATKPAITLTTGNPIAVTSATTKVTTVVAPIITLSSTKAPNVFTVTAGKPTPKPEVDQKTTLTPTRASQTLLQTVSRSATSLGATLTNQETSPSSSKNPTTSTAKATQIVVDTTATNKNITKPATTLTTGNPIIVTSTATKVTTAVAPITTMSSTKSPTFSTATASKPTPKPEVDQKTTLTTKRASQTLLQTVFRSTTTPGVSLKDLETSPSSSTNPVISTAKATPKVFDTTATNELPTAAPTAPQIYDHDVCKMGGFLHRLVLNSCCSLYMQQGNSGQMSLRECPVGTKFDVYSCYCRNSAEVACLDQTPGIPVVTLPTPSSQTERPPSRFGDSCISNNNIYRIVPNSGCAKFTHQGQDSHVMSQECAAGTSFDLDVCVCRHSHEFQCSDRDNGELFRPTPAPTPVWTRPTFNIHTDPPVRIGDVCLGGNKIFGLVPNTGCTKFTQQSQDGRLFELNCPAGLQFDINVCVCRYEWDVKCPDKSPSAVIPTRPQPTPSRASSLPPVRIGEECYFGSSVYRVAPQSGCSKFTQQGEDGGMFLFACPGELKFNLDSCACTYAEEVQCSDKTFVKDRPTVGSPTAVVTPDEPVRKGDSCLSIGNVYTIVPASGCRRFAQQTADGKVKVMDCPTGLRFDLSSCVCNYDYLVTCSDNTILQPEPTTVTPGKPDPKADCCLSHGNVYTIVPASGCRRVSQRTIDGKTKVLDCPAGMRFDVNSCFCEHDSLVTCSENNLILPKPTTVTQEKPVRKGDSCLSSGNVYTIVPASRCRRFAQQTADGTVKVLDCPSGLIFDLSSCVCDHQYLVTCSDNSFMQPETTTKVPPIKIWTSTNPVTNVGGKCVSFGNLYALAPKAGCKWFTQLTADGVYRLHSCPAGLKFDLDECVCRYADDFVCKEEDDAEVFPTAITSATTQAARTNAPPTRIDDACTASGYIFRLLPYCGCSRYTRKAYNGDMTLQECSSGLLFDLNSCTCRPAGSFFCDDPSSPVPTNSPPAPPKVKTTPVQVWGSGTLNDGTRSCKAGGNVYRIVKNTSCQRFIQEAPGNRIVENSCPGGLQFDMNLCICRYPEDMQCIDY